MKKERKYKVFEYTTSDYGKGYVLAGNTDSANKKALKQTGGKFRPLMTSHYDRVTKKEFKKKYGWF